MISLPMRGLILSSILMTGATGAFAADVDFDKDIKPIFREKCYGCHGPTQQMSGLRLDRRETVLMGGRGRPDLVPGAIERSSIYLRVAGTTQGPRMPLTGETLTPEQIDTIKTWIEQGAKWPDEPPPSHDWQPDPRLTPLFEQIRSGNFKAVREAVASDAGLLRAHNAKGDTLLMRTALDGTVEDVQWLLGKGADPNAGNLAGATPLLWAVDDVAKVRALLNAGANANAHTDNGRTPLLVALDQKRAAPVIRALMDKGATVTPEPGQADPLVQVAQNGDLESMNLLVTARGGKFPPAVLAAAAQSDCLECVRVVLSQSPPKDAVTAALRAAARLGPVESLKFLFAAGADVNAKDAAGGTALLRAAYVDFPDPARIKLLLDHGAETNVRDASGDTPLMKARRRGETKIVELLVNAGAKE